MNIKEHLNFLLEEYKLKKLFNLFILLSIITLIIICSFHWILLIFSNIIKTHPNLIIMFSTILLCVYALSIPLKKYLKEIIEKLLYKVKLANIKFFNDKIKNMNKYDLLQFDLNDYYSKLHYFNDDLDKYILIQQHEYQIPFYFITLLIIALNKNNVLILIIFAIFYISIRLINEIKINEEGPIITQLSGYEKNIRKYFINSKMFLINDEFNEKYLLNNVCNYEKSKSSLNNLDDKLDNKSNIIMLIFMSIIIFSQIDKLDQYDFFYYFLIAFDIEFISNKLAEYYKNKVINKMEMRLEHLYNINTSDNTSDNTSNGNNEPITQIHINELVNNNPKLSITKPIIINKNDHILVSGVSGGGKTSLLYILKGIISPDILKIEPSISNIISQSFISIQNNQNLFSEKLYNIITNHKKHPNIDLINFSLKFSKLDHLLNKNDYINIEKLSSGERGRLYISQIIYTIKTHNYKILLFDELDQNLNNELSIELCANIKKLFKNKIILYISHNSNIAKLFKKEFIIKDGIINIK